MAAHPDVLVLGGGVIGLTTAYYLSGQGVSVTVLDRGAFGQQASWAGAGIIPPGNPAKAQTPLDRLRAVSSGLFPSLSQQLRDETGIDNGYLVCGGIEFPEADEPLTAPWVEEGIAFEALDHAGLQGREPGLSAALKYGCFLPGMAQVRNPRHLKALVAACEARAVGLMPGCAVYRLQGQRGRIVAVETEEGRLEADRIVVASGAWSDELLAPLGWQPGIKPVRGQIALLKTATEAVRPILLRGKRYLVPRPDGRVLAGATEEEVGFDARATAGGVAGLLAFAEELIPSLREATLERCWAGLRPGSADGLPTLGVVPGFSNLFLAAGHFRAGIQLSAATGLVMTELLLGQPPTVPLEAFRADRSPAPAARTAFRS